MSSRRINFSTRLLARDHTGSSTFSGGFRFLGLKTVELNNFPNDRFDAHADTNPTLNIYSKTVYTISNRKDIIYIVNAHL